MDPGIHHYGVVIRARVISGSTVNRLKPSNVQKLFRTDVGKLRGLAPIRENYITTLPFRTASPGSGYAKPFHLIREKNKLIQPKLDLFQTYRKFFLSQLFNSRSAALGK